MAEEQVGTSLRKACRSLLKTIEERAEGGGVSVIGLSSGIKSLDDKMGGFRKKAVTVVAARTGLGKSSLALGFLIHAAMNGEFVLLASFEMNAEMIALRALSSLTGIPGYNIERGLLTKDQLNELQTILPIVDGMKFGIIDTPMTSDDLMDHVKNYQQEVPLGLVVADYASLFRDKSDFGETQRINNISGNMMALAHECDIPVILVAQLNRQVDHREGHLPVLSDLKDGGDLEADAFHVLFPIRPSLYASLEEEGYQPKEVEYDAKIIVAKNRQGEAGIMVPVAFHPKTMRWTDQNIVSTPPPSLKSKVRKEK